MIRLTRIFDFEMAHAIHGYSGACRNLHGHSYELHVTVAGRTPAKGYIPGTGFVIDFKELKRLVQRNIIDVFDHKVILSKAYIAANALMALQENLVVFEAEPTAENLLIHFKEQLAAVLPPGISIEAMKLYETKSSYAEWIACPENDTQKLPTEAQKVSSFN